MLIGQRPDVEGRPGFGRDHVHAIPAVQHRGRHRGPKRGRGARFIGEEPFVDRVPRSDFRDRGGEAHHRVGAKGNRGMSRNAPGDELDRARDLLERLHARELHRSAAADHVGALGEAVLRVDLRKMLFGRELDADPGRSLLARFHEEDHVAVEGDVAALERQHGHEAGGDVVLVVDGAPGRRCSRPQIKAIVLDASGTVSGTVSASDLTPTLTAGAGVSDCPYRIVGTWRGDRITGTYTAFNCLVRSDGTLELRKQ